MRFNVLSSLAAGMFIATSISSVVYISNKDDVSKPTVKKVENQTKATELPSEKEMKDKLVSAGYVVQTKAEYDKKIADEKATAQKGASSDNSKQKVVYRAIIAVKKGMTSIDVGKQLVKAKLIPNAFKFSKDVEKKGIENHLRPGSFVVDSSMSYDKIMSTIFK